MIIEQIIAHADSKNIWVEGVWKGDIVMGTISAFRASLRLFLPGLELFSDLQDRHAQDMYESYVSSDSFDI